LFGAEGGPLGADEADNEEHYRRMLAQAQNEVAALRKRLTDSQVRGSSSSSLYYLLLHHHDVVVIIIIIFFSPEGVAAVVWP
jgi:hypothetical protein